MEELKDIIKELQSYRISLSLGASDDMILDCATRIFNSHQIKKQGNSTHQVGDSPASLKQINYLKKLGYQDDTSKLTKQDAKQLIGKLK